MQDRIKSDRRVDDRRIQQISVNLERRTNKRRSGSDRRIIEAG